MRLVAGLMLVSMISPALAQERQFTITVPESHLNYIARVLGKQPYEEASVVIDPIKEQVRAQERREAAAAISAERERIRSELKAAPAEEPKP